MNEAPLRTAARPGRMLGARAVRPDPWLVRAVLVFLALSALWARAVPIPANGLNPAWRNFNPDEYSHIAVVQFIADHHRLPTFGDGWTETGDLRVPWESTYKVTMHPPFYYILGAAVYGAARPVAGVMGAARLVRLLSCLMGAAVVWLTYLTARLLVSRATARLAAGCVAGVPMFVSLSGAVSNEILSALCASAALYLMVLGLRDGFDTRRALALSVWVALGVGTKFTCLALLPAAWLAFWWAGRRRGLTVPRRLGQMALAGGAAVLAVGWWLARNHRLYGAFVRASISEQAWDILQPGYALQHARAGVSAPRYTISLLNWGWRSFWGWFDGESRPLPPTFYGMLLMAHGVAALGAGGLWGRVRRREFPLAAAAVMGVFALGVLAIFFQFNWKHFTPQGRYFFPLLLPFGLTLAAGWRAAWAPRLRGAASGALLAGLFLLNLYCLAVYSHR